MTGGVVVTGGVLTGELVTGAVMVLISDTVHVTVPPPPGAAIANGSPTGWQADTSVHFVGSAVAADPTSVSGFEFVTSKEKSVDYLAFAVADSNGGCAAGLLLSDASYTNVAKASAVPLPAGAACTSDAAATAAGY